MLTPERKRGYDSKRFLQQMSMARRDAFTRSWIQKAVTAEKIHMDQSQTWQTSTGTGTFGGAAAGLGTAHPGRGCVSGVAAQSCRVFTSAAA